MSLKQAVQSDASLAALLALPCDLPEGWRVFEAAVVVWGTRSFLLVKE